MKVKKLLSTLVALVMLLGLFPTGAVATGPMAQIGDNTYPTLENAISAASNGATIKVTQPVTTAEAVKITKTLTIDLNGCTVKTSGADGNGVFMVTTGGNLTLEDTSEGKTGKVDGVGGDTENGYHMAVWAKGGTVTINGGIYTNVGASGGADNTQYDLIYAGSSQGGGGSITINGGTFESQTPQWTLNTNDTNGTITVKGGSFKGYNPADAHSEPENPKSFVAAGYQSAQDGDYWKVTADFEAAIGETKYAKLADAMAAGGTVKLLKNITLGDTIIVTKNVTLELDGKTITAASGWTRKYFTTDHGYTGTYAQDCSDSMLIVVAGAALTIQDSSEAETGAITVGEANPANLYSVVKMTSKSVNDTAKTAGLEVKGGTLTGNYYGVTGNGTRDNTSITVSGGTIKGTVTNDSTGIYHPQGGTLTVTGGTMEGANGIYLCGGTLNISGNPTVKGVGANAEPAASGDGFTATGDALVVEVRDNSEEADHYGVPTVSISGGTFTSTSASAVASYARGELTALDEFITGGTFSSDPTALVKEHHLATRSGDVWTVAENYEAAIGETKYTTLAGAVSTASAGATIKVLKDVTTAAAVEIAKTLTIDLNGCTVKTSGADGNGVFMVTSNGNLTLVDTSEGKTGKVDGVGQDTAGYHMAVWAKGGTVTINGGTYVNSNIPDAYKGSDTTHYDLIYAGSSENHGGSITINGGTFESQTPQWTLNTNDTNGTITVKGGSFKGYNPADAHSEPVNPKSFVAAGYQSAQDGDYWKVTETPSPTPDPDPDPTPSSRPSSSGSSSSTVTPNPNSPTVSTETKDNGDGSTTKIETKKDGTVVETTTGKDGSSTTTASKTEVKENRDGSTTTTTTSTTTATDGDGKKTTSTTVEETKAQPNGASTTTTTTTTKEADGSTTKSKTVSETKVDANGKETTTSTTTVTSTNGSTSTTTTAANGSTSTQVSLSSSAANTAKKNEEPASLPMPAVEASSTGSGASTVEVNVPKGGATVEIPVSNVSASTVVVVVHPDGTEEIVKTSTVTKNGVVVTLEEGATLKIINNEKEFDDVEKGSTFDEAISFVTARELFGGTSESTFSPDSNATRGQLMTVLARLSGAEAGSISQGMDWAKENGISDGTNADKPITRQQLAVMLWRFAGSPESTASLDHVTDRDEVADYAEVALRWAIENGILGGYADGSVRPGAPASRAHVAAFMQRYCNVLN